MDDLAAAAERRLGVRFSRVERISDERSPKIVLRGEVDGGAAVIVKHDTRRHGADAADTLRRFANEWAGAQLLDGLGLEQPIGPRFLGGDVAPGFVALADLESTGSLVKLLTGDDPAAAEAALLDYAELLGRLHAATAGRLDEYRRIREAVEPGGDARSGHGIEIDRLAGRAPVLVRSLGVEPAAGFEAELDAAMARLSAPGPFQAYQHSDSCPDNFTTTPAGPRLLDFEHSGFGHALIDASVIEMAFPTCWCASRVPERIVADALARYRAAFSAAADDRLFDEAYVDACAFWGFRVAIFAKPAEFLAEEREWGIATTRQRTLYWVDRLARVAAARERLPAVGGTAARLAMALRERWPGFDELPLFPAFR